MRILLFLITFLFFSLNSFSQDDDLMDLLESEEKPVTHYTTATFKTTKIVSSNSVETNGEGQLNFVIQHRFGRVTDGVDQFFGLDNANIRIGLEYGVFDNLDIGIGRSFLDKTLDFFVKYRVLRQSKGAKVMPITLAGFASMQIKTGPFSVPSRTNYFSSRMSYTYQVMIARKFGKWVSFQLSPTLTHINLVTRKADSNDIFSLGAGTSIRVSGSFRINVEYYWVVPGQIVSLTNGEKVRDALSIGVDIETGGHVFQMHVTNSRGMIEKMMAVETTGDWLKGQLSLGFNITRAFAIYDAKKMKQKRVLKKSLKKINPS